MVTARLLLIRLPEIVQLFQPLTGRRLPRGARAWGEIGGDLAPGYSLESFVESGGRSAEQVQGIAGQEAATLGVPPVFPERGPQAPICRFGPVSVPARRGE